MRATTSGTASSSWRGREAGIRWSRCSGFRLARLQHSETALRGGTEAPSFDKSHPKSIAGDLLDAVSHTGFGALLEEPLPLPVLPDRAPCGDADGLLGGRRRRERLQVRAPDAEPLRLVEHRR